MKRGQLEMPRVRSAYLERLRISKAERGGARADRGRADDPREGKRDERSPGERAAEDARSASGVTRHSGEA